MFLAKNKCNEIKVEASQNICEDSSYLNSLKGIGYFGENRVAPLVTQVRTAYFSMDCGMCYVIRLFDGRFVILDANTGEYEENERLFDLLNSQNRQLLPLLQMKHPSLYLRSQTVHS